MILEESMNRINLLHSEPKKTSKVIANLRILRLIWSLYQVKLDKASFL